MVLQVRITTSRFIVGLLRLIWDMLDSVPPVEEDEDEGEAAA